MGNKQMSIKGDLLIQFTRDKIIQGQPLEGSIILRMATDCPPAQIKVRVWGQESGKFREQAKKGSMGDGKTRTFNENILNQTFLLKKFE